MFKEVFESVYEQLPEEITNNRVFEEILKTIMGQIPENLSLDKILLCVSPEIFRELGNFYSEEIEEVIISESEESLFNITYIRYSVQIIKNLKKDELGYKLKTYINFSNNTSKKIILTMREQRNKVEVINENKDNEIYNDFHYDVFYYDDNGKNINGIDTERVKDEYFSEEFYVPVKEARKYRLNFKQYKNFLSRNRFQMINKIFEERLVDNLFRPPFKIEDLEKFIREEMEREISLAITSEPNEYILTGVLDQIIANLKNIIGKSDGVVISENLYQNLSFYLLGLTSNMLYNQGLLIKKEEGNYTLYQLHLNNNGIIGIPTPLKKEDLKFILNSNPLNLEVSGLQEFFGIDKTR